MRLNLFKMLSLAFALALAGAFVGCEVDDENADGSGGETDTAGGDTGEGGGGEGDTGEGGEGGEGGSIVDQFCSDPTSDCGSNGFCCFLCENTASGDVTDPDCNTTTPFNSDKSNNKTSPNNCACDYWGFVCEAAVKGKSDPCSCDADCTLPNGTILPACAEDFHCDTFCPTGTDPDCN